MKKKLTMNHEKKVRVMHVVQSAGGVEQYLVMLLKYIDREKYENILVCSQDFHIDKFEGLVSHIIVIDMKREIGLNDIIALIEVRKEIREYKPDVVYAHSSKAGVITRLADLGINNKSIYNSHGWAFNMRGLKVKKFFYIIIEKVMSHFCDKIICISEAEKKSALKYRICSEEKLDVICNGIDIEEYKKSRSNKLTRMELGIPNDAIVIGTVGRLSEQKAPDVFIKVAVEMKKIIPNAYFIMVGDGNQKDEVLEYAKLNGIDNSLIITNWVDDPICYIRLFNVAVLLSRWEGFGLVLPEYMMCGVPIVATRVDAIPYIIKDHVNGLLVSVDSVDETCKAIIEILNDEDLRTKLIEQGQKIAVDQYDIRRVVKEYSKLF